MNKDILLAEEVADILNVAESTAYKIIRGLNNELKAAGYKTFSGRISRKYFYERFGLKTA